MCGIGGAIHLAGAPIKDLHQRLGAMNDLQAHRGPDDHAIWMHPSRHVGLAHRRLTIIDLSELGRQPMANGADRLVCNGEIYNYVELRAELGTGRFRSESDSEILLHGYRDRGPALLDDLRGMYAFALWDESKRRLWCARDRFGIKPFYYTVVGDILYFASEIKALLPFLPSIKTNPEALADYATFQFVLGRKTLFEGVYELPAAHMLTVEDGQITTRRYWEVFYERDFDHTDDWFRRNIDVLLNDSVDLHLRADVDVGAYVSGGIDSSLVASMAMGRQVDQARDLVGFTGRFADGPEFDETPYARAVAQRHGFTLHERTITPTDFVDNIERVIYHLDTPVAGPGSFPQFMVSETAARHRKVVLGGQGGDEVFGGYARYLIAYFEQCIKAALEGRLHDGEFVVTYESIIPNLRTLEAYKPLLQSFWRDGVFGPMDERYFRLINRMPDGPGALQLPDDYHPFSTFSALFNADNVDNGAYFDAMTHFDFKTLLPALLQVEDRMSMAHGLEARVPLLDHRVVEMAARIPADVKFKNGQLKRLLRKVARPYLPAEVLDRKDKMGFPVPLTAWLQGPVRDFVLDVFDTGASRSRPHIDTVAVKASVGSERRFGRQTWGHLSLELWHQQFHDRAAAFRSCVDEASPQRVLD